MDNSIAQSLNEIVLVDKPKGITSYDVIRRLKSNYPKKTKIGHSGTLDPFATGLLIILIGKETKRQDEFHQMDKEYVATAIFGKESDTLDSDGKIVNQNDIEVSQHDLEDEIKKRFLGKILQKPPKYSAVHVNGKRAYDLARVGVDFELSPKEVQIYSFEILEFNWPNIVFKIVCGSGTYIRSLVSDLAHSFDTYAYLGDLRRIRIGEYNVNDAIKLENT